MQRNSKIVNHRQLKTPPLSGYIWVKKKNQNSLLRVYRKIAKGINSLDRNKSYFGLQ